MSALSPIPADLFEDQSDINIRALSRMILMVTYGVDTKTADSEVSVSSIVYTQPLMITNAKNSSSSRMPNMFPIPSMTQPCLARILSTSFLHVCFMLGYTWYPGLTRYRTSEASSEVVSLHDVPSNWWLWSSYFTRVRQQTICVCSKSNCERIWYKLYSFLCYR